MNIGGIVLFKILETPSEALESWSQIKNVYFTGEYLTIYSSIAKFYDKHSYLPTFNELTITIRDGLTKSKINALAKLEIPEDIPLELAVEALTNEFAQTEVLAKLDKFVDNVTLLDSEEIKEEIANILLYLEEKTHSAKTICTMKDISVQKKEEVLLDLMSLGFNNSYDAEVRLASTELLMLGGKKGTGKSILSTNIVANQYKAGNTALYFSIEMRAREPFNRLLCHLSGVNADRFRLGTLTAEDYDKIAPVRCGFFQGGDEVLEQYYDTRDYFAMERELVDNRQLKADNQIIIVDDQKVSLMDIDMSIQKYKAQYGDNLKVVVVDYVNQIQIEDIYSWQSQIELSKGLKDLARKYNVAMITPYQIDDAGVTRFSKGILDAADIAITLEMGSNHIRFKSTKTRGTKVFDFASGMNWDTLTVDPIDVQLTDDSDEDEAEKVEKPKFKKEVDDIPF